MFHFDVSYLWLKFERCVQAIKDRDLCPTALDNK